MNIEGTEEFVPDQTMPTDDSYINNDEEVEEDIDYDESFSLDGFHESLELDDFVNDEH